MSFVGTRPEVTKYVKKYTKEMRATVISLYDYHSVITERMEKNGIKIIYLNKKSGLDLSLTFKLVKIFKEYKPDVVHSHLYAGKYAHVAASICGVPGKVYGQGELEEAIKELVKNLNMDQNIFFCGLTDDVYSVRNPHEEPSYTVNS